MSAMTSLTSSCWCRSLLAMTLMLTSLCGTGHSHPRPQRPLTTGYAMGNQTHYVECSPKPHQFLLLQMGPAFDSRRMALLSPERFLLPEESADRQGNTHQRRSRRPKREVVAAEFEWGDDTSLLDYISGFQYSGNSSDSDSEDAQSKGRVSRAIRRRRRRHSDSSGEGGQELDTGMMDAAAGSNSTDISPRLRHVKHATTTLTRRRRKETKKALQKAASGLRKPPWQCEMETKWKKMKDGIFPPFIQVGKCTQPTCMYGMFECTPKKYVIKVLKRDSQRCQPIPTLSSTTQFEEAWTFHNYAVTVCCDCARKRAGRKKSGQ